jgi:FkbM family methyltransferase
VIVAGIKSLLRPFRTVLKRNPDKFLNYVSGVVHVGANTGQERDLYNGRGLSVVWIEPIPEVFAQLKTNISGLSNQRAFQALVTDTDDREYEFHIANNNGASSSVLDLKQHRDVWPDIEFTATLAVKSMTLATLFEKEQIDVSKYQALILDTQGSELLVLEGALPILHHFQFIKTEVPDFESYEGCCQLSDIRCFMKEHGYREFSRNKFATRVQGGSYFDIVYKQQP